ncbi:hypothetical protein L3Q82_007923 [Scortum barcoo]|uniref:Uncharacterized protein n=1 Tax=Scortum barcoo TaxID=214431 RepID=A0ACB8WLP6_9TELE|nr:hypothetical protein L3Q82_007923 [Scortum barcoo]
MAGLCGLKILLLCAGIINSANCSYTVTTIKFGFKIDITSVNIGNCVNSFSFTTSIRVDFLNPSEIQVTAPTGLPANIITTLPPNCNDLTIDYTCLEQQNKYNKPKNLSELEPFTDYSCTGQIKDNNVPINKTKAVEFQIDCDLGITITEQSATNTSIDLSWTTTSKNCRDDDLQNLFYDCSCSSDTTKQTGKVTGNKHPTGGKCRVAQLNPYQHYTCEVFATYNSKKVGRKEVKQETEIGTSCTKAHHKKQNPNARASTYCINRLNKQPVTTRSVRRWSPEKESALRDCFNTTVWDVLLNPHGEDIEGMTHCLTDYLNFCADVVSPVKTVRCYPNNKPWVTREVKTVLNKKKGCLQEQRQGGHESSTAGGETLCEGSQGQLQEKGGAEAEGKTT